MSGKEYKFLGNTMENISIKYGIFLVVWAAIASIITQSESITSWIPAIIGFPIFFFGWLSRINPAKKKLFMHFSVSFGFLAFIACAGAAAAFLGFLSAFIAFIDFAMMHETRGQRTTDKSNVLRNIKSNVMA